MSRARLPQQNERLLRALTDGSVTFAVIGGVAALLHGASRPKDIAVALELEAAREREESG